MTSFAIEEITGSRRQIILDGRAKPYQEGVKWGGRTRTKLTSYPGNSRASQQILGPEELPTEINGFWKDRFMEGAVRVVGFSAINTAQDLVDAMDSIRVYGNLLRVQWGPYVRLGILKEFTAEPVRLEDIKWDAEFEWIGKATSKATFSAPEKITVSALRTRVNDVDDALAFEPEFVFPNLSAQILDKIQSLRERATALLDIVRQAQSFARTPALAFGSLATAAESVRLETEDVIESLIDIPRVTMTTSDRLADVLSLEVWRRSVASRASQLRALSQRKAREAEKEARPGALAVYIVPENSTLRQVSQSVYGTADAWQVLADFNGFSGSEVPAGTVVVVPPAPASQGVKSSGILQA